MLSILLAAAPALLFTGAALAFRRWRRTRPRHEWLLLAVSLLLLSVFDTMVIALAPLASAIIISHTLALVGAVALLAFLLHATSVSHTDGTRFQRFAEATFEGVAFVEKGRITYANQRLAAMLDVESSALAGMELDRLLLPQSVKPRDRTAPEGYDRIYEARARRREGGSFPVEVLEGVSTAAGKRERFLIIRDITDQRKTEELFRESEESFRELAESVTQVFFRH